MELPKFLKFLELSSENSLKLLNSNNNRTKRFLSFIGVLNLNKTNDTGQTLLQQAIENNQTEVAKYLVDKGAKLDLQNKTGKIPLDMADKSPTNIAETLYEEIKLNEPTSKPQNTNLAQQIASDTIPTTPNVPIVKAKGGEEPYYNPQAAELGKLIRGNPTSLPTSTSAQQVANELAAQQNAKKIESANPTNQGMKRVVVKKVTRSSPGQNR